MTAYIVLYNNSTINKTQEVKKMTEEEKEIEREVELDLLEIAIGGKL